MSTQATVRSWDGASGTVVRDDGTELPVPAGALDPAVRLLRPGQRVRAEVADGVVVRLTLVGLPFTEPPPA